MKKLIYLGLAVSIVAVLLLSMGGAALADDTKEIYVKQASLSLQDDCDDISLWHFVINQIASSEDKPANITVELISRDAPSDPAVEVVVPLGEPFEACVAHYTLLATDDNVPENAEVVDAWTDIYLAWDGQFVLSHVDCPAPPVPEFTPIVLVGIGLLGLAAYMGWKKRKAVLETRSIS